MTMSATRTLRRLLMAGITAATVVPLAASASAAAAPVQNPAPTAGPSACQSENYRGAIVDDVPSAGTRHYRVTLTAAPGTEACTLQGSPAKVIFMQGNGPAGVDSTPYGDQRIPVAFGPSNPVHFDISTPNTPGGAPITGANFNLTAPRGVIPGQGYAGGGMELDRGTKVGPVQPGA